MTLTAETSEQPYSGMVWRAVEGQNIISTMPLVGNDLAKQQLLESILDSSKPPMPACFRESTQNLDYLLFTPFRYPAQGASALFLRTGVPGLFSGAQSKRAALAESGYWTCRFLQASGELQDKPMITKRTLFQVSVACRSHQFRGEASNLLLPGNPWMELGLRLRERGVGAILYESPYILEGDSETSVAVLDPTALACKKPVAMETWNLSVMGTKAVFMRKDLCNDESFSFDYASLFAAEAHAKIHATAK